MTGLALLLAAVTASSGAVDVTRSREVDVTGDGLAEQVTLRYRGDGWNAPFTWDLSIRSMGALVYEHHADDAAFDEFFGDEGFVADCQGARACKEKYYDRDLLARLVVPTDLSANPHAFDPANSGAIQHVAGEELQKRHGLSPAAAAVVVSAMIDRLKRKALPALYVPASPAQDDFPLMYVEEVHAFVTIYHW